VSAPAKAATSASDPKAVQLSNKMLKAEETLAFSGEQVTQTYDNGKLTHSSEQAYSRVGNKGALRIFHSPAKYAGRMIGDNGTIEWVYQPGKKVATSSRSKLRLFQAESVFAKRQIAAGLLLLHVVGCETISGKAGVIVQADPIPGAKCGSKRFTIEPVTGAQLRIVTYSPNGKPLSDSYFISIDFNAQNVSFSPPPGISVKAETARHMSIKSIAPAALAVKTGFIPLFPQYSPPSFEFHGGEIIDDKDGKTLCLYYSNGLTTILVSEKSALPVVPEQNPPRMGGLNIAFNTVNGVNVIAVGNEDPAELAKMTHSLR
jgi:hypothetical protein